jgi:hypothetical protein
LFLAVSKFTENELNIKTKEELPNFKYENRIGGGIFGGDTSSLLSWHIKYYEMLEYFISINRFIGKDQHIINSVYLMDRNQCHLVDHPPKYYNPWFYLQDYLL